MSAMANNEPALFLEAIERRYHQGESPSSPSGPGNPWR